MLQAEGIHQRFGERRVLEGVDLEVPPGQVIGLLGPNGAGKTTLMRILFGVIPPDEGEVLWDDRPATPEDRRSWGYMPQERGLYREMRVLEQVAWMGRLHGMDRSAAEAAATQLLERLGLGDRVGDKIQDLSGGMAQRVQLAAAMVHDPPLLVLDEPFAGLDPVAVRVLTDVVLAHVTAGGHLVFSSHQLDRVEDLCESVTMIDHGRVVLQGRVRDLKAASEARVLWVDAQVPDGVVSPEDGEVATSTEAESEVRLAPGADAGEVLDRIRAVAPVAAFAVRAPSLSQLFLDAAGAPAETGV